MFWGHEIIKMRWRKKGAQHTMKTPSSMVRVIAPFMLVLCRIELYLGAAAIRLTWVRARRNMCIYRDTIRKSMVKNMEMRQMMT
jgi:hypothetical protein